MDNSSPKQSRLLGRLLGRLRGEHRYSTLDKNVSFSSTEITEDIGCGNDEDEEQPTRSGVYNPQVDNAQLAANIDMRYSGQYLTPEQLPEFCRQLNHLVEVIRNIQSYGKVVGEYPRDMERELEREANEVAALASEARNAHDTVQRVQLQRRALREQRSQLVSHLTKLRESDSRAIMAVASLRCFSVGCVLGLTLLSSKTAKSLKIIASGLARRLLVCEALSEGPLQPPLATLTLIVRVIQEVRELETSVRISDRRLFKNWETIKDSADPAAFETLLEEVRNKQTALECLVRLIEGRQAQLSRSLAFPLALPNNDDTLVPLPSRRRHDNRRTSKRRRANHDSNPISTEQSNQPKQVTLYITGGPTVTEPVSRRRATSVLPSLELPRGSVRDIMFFTAS